MDRGCGVDGFASRVLELKLARRAAALSIDVVDSRPLELTLAVLMRGCGAEGANPPEFAATVDDLRGAILSVVAAV